MNESRIIEAAVKACEWLTMITVDLEAGKLRVIRDQLNGQPRAQSYEPTGGSGEVWCWEHERETRRCHEDGLLCSGEAISVHDRTGEAAISHDRAAADLRAVEKHVRSIHRATDALLSILSRYDARTATDKERFETEMENERKCESCWRIGWWNAVHRSSDVGGNLPVARDLCVACYEVVRRHLGRMPTVAEVEHFREHGKWPKRHETKKRGRAA